MPILANSLVGRSACPAALLFAAALLLSGCGGAETSGPEHPESATAAASSSANAKPPLRTTVYFLTKDRTAPLGVRRNLTRRPQVTTARLALEKLIAGPTAAERRRGLATAIPAGTTIRSMTIELRARRSQALVDLSGLPSAEESDSVLRVRVMTQVARTLIGLSDIERVRLRVDGRAWGLWDMEGNVSDGAIDYDRLRGFFHICAARPGTETVPGDCFTALP